MTVPTQSAAEARPSAREHDGNGHLLRLCLDLQLDAMMLTLGALATDPEDGIPWRRWISEDIDLACALAEDAIAGNAALPPTLGSDLSHAMPATAIDDLVAHYRSMLGLLEDLARRTDPSGRPARIDEDISRCQARLDELRGHRLVPTPSTGIDVRARQHFLPGELLG
jgi:hypothetical protein